MKRIWMKIKSFFSRKEQNRDEMIRDAYMNFTTMCPDNLTEEDVKVIRELAKNLK